MKKKIVISALSLSLLLSSCATIISGSKQKVSFHSNPAQAAIFIDEVEVGKTPFEIKLERNKEHHVMIKLDGYQTYETNLTKKFNAWYLGNIVFGGIIGIIIDPITGAIYNLTPNDVKAEMNKGTAFKLNKKDIYIGVALKENQNWEKIAQLDKK
nr:PEGA domain-containing protein [uncultured Flavobacterium sp.]